MALIGSAFPSASERGDAALFTGLPTTQETNNTTWGAFRIRKNALEEKNNLNLSRRDMNWVVFILKESHFYISNLAVAKAFCNYISFKYFA